MTSPRILGVIPARGGSKGVLRKNIRLVGGKPLIQWTIEAAQGSFMLTDTMVSSDDSEVIELATHLGCPAMVRPPSLATDTAPMVPVLEDVLARFRGSDYVCLLQPTSPQRTADDIDAALTIMVQDWNAPADKAKLDSVVSVYEVADQHPARMYTVAGDGWLLPYNAVDHRNYVDGLRQNLPHVYHRNGAIYACRADLLRKEHELIGKRTLPYVMPRERSWNIDDMFDLKVADFLMTR